MSDPHETLSPPALWQKLPLLLALCALALSVGYLGHLLFIPSEVQPELAGAIGENLWFCVTKTLAFIAKLAGLTVLGVLLAESLGDVRRCHGIRNRNGCVAACAAVGFVCLIHLLAKSIAGPIGGAVTAAVMTLLALVGALRLPAARRKPESGNAGL